jgi:DNA-binding response OmpR family regulator
LPGKTGLDVLTGLRSRGSDVPVLIVTARDQTAARVEGLDAGADDYLVKPFDLDELLARIRAVMRRRVSRSRSVVRHGPLVLNLATHEVMFDGEAVRLSAREFAVLRALMNEPGSIVGKAKLEEQLYGWDAEIESNAIDVYIHHLRRKIGAAFIVTVRGVGFKLAPQPCNSAHEYHTAALAGRAAGGDGRLRGRRRRAAVPFAAQGSQ